MTTTTSTPFRMTGYRPDPPDIVIRRNGYHLFAARKGITVSPLPLSTNNRQWLLPSKGGPGILNQGQTGSCVGHALAAATTLRFALQLKPISLVSPIGWYNVARSIDRGPDVHGNLPALQDQGSEPSQAIRGAQEWGVESAATWGNYPADPKTINNEATLKQLEDAAEFTLNGAYFLNSTGNQRYLDIMVALAAKYPVPIAVCASGNTFQSYQGGILGRQTGPNDHYIYAIDYTWDGTNPASIILIGSNNWGEDDWGESDVTGIRGGMWRGNSQFIDQAMDLCVLDVEATGVEA